MCHSGELAVVEVEGVYYYSSSWKHLDSCTGGNSKVFKEGEVWRFSADGTVARSTDEESGVKEFIAGPDDYSYYEGYCSSSAYTTHRNRAKGGQKTWWEDHNATVSSANSSDVKDYDKEWVDAWASYCAANDDDAEPAQSIHSMSDDQFNQHERP
jgi:hypothetical protein